MRRRFLAVLFVVCLTATVAVDAVWATENRIRIDGGTVEAEVSLELTSDEPINYWRAEVGLPDGARVESVTDGLGEIDGYETGGGTLGFTTNTGVARRTETVTVEYVVENATVRRYADGRLRTVDVGFVGFGNGNAQETTARVTAEETVLSTSYADGFDVDVTGDGAVYDGEGASTVRVAVGGYGGYENYAVYGDADLSEADRLYGMLPGVFGFESTAYRHPVVVLNGTRYDDVAEGWSDAQHRTGGVTLLRGSAPDHTSSVLHETAHAYNAEALAWTDATVGWFEEGTARYVEFLADRRRGETRRALFAGDRIRNGSRVAPVSSVDALLDYYEDGGFMRVWNPVHDSENRRFGYGFSELVVRSYVEENGATALRRTYDHLLSTEGDAATAETASGVILDAMGDDPDILRPCEAPSRNATIDCLRGVNRMSATVPGYEGATRETYAFGTSNLVEDGDGTAETGSGTANRTPGDGDSREGEADGGVLSAVRQLLAGIADFLRGLFASVTVSS
ncbi:hypothetical protein EGH25_06680 [Haladaptatus sp. F3-133]|uniref:Uncharacterized protein n=1 Tax=Halorutilus salinus TaxID=2487751 RepID=A0A9Q4GHQ3_9EURY|nr:hypothetical protein [Halorutilus salinus]MCX2819035.1 hypothetical protein [Halorutilus salinus]